MTCERPGVAHTWLALEDTETIVFSKGPRSGRAYESDTQRLDVPLIKDKPEPIKCRNFDFCGNLEEVRWSKNRWHPRGRCSPCNHLFYAHGLTPEEKAILFAGGCGIQGCPNPPAHIDHDHSICAKENHSCNKCRRGALCHHHNAKIISVIDDLQNGKLRSELDYLGIKDLIFEKGERT